MWTEQMGSSRGGRTWTHTQCLAHLSSLRPRNRGSSVPGSGVVSRSAAFPGPWGPGLHPGIPSLNSCGQGGTEAQGPHASTSLLVVRASSPSNSRNRWPKRLSGVEVVWSAEVVREFGGEGRAYQGDPCSPGCPEGPPSRD